MSDRTLVVIPAYNEEATIEQVVRLSQLYADVCVVDDASTDRTPQIVKSIPGAHHLRHTRNTHIARAILDGMQYAADAGYDYCITMDAGMSHDPHAIPLFLEQRDAGLVIGYRQAKVNVPAQRRLLSWIGNLMINLALQSQYRAPQAALAVRGRQRYGLRDATSGYRMYSRPAYELLLNSRMVSRTFDFHLEALAHVYLSGLSIAEVPITYVFSNSSLRWKIVYDALRTCLRIWTSDDFRVPAGAQV